jgi:dTDP-4-amino-4,6-dideoxygalactose transaminase
MYCGEPGHSPVELFADWVSGSRSRASARNNGRKVIFTQSGRAAIRLAAEVWNVGKNDEVLVPAYNCGSEISPFLELGAKIKMYRVDNNAKIDVDDLLNRMTSNTRVVVVTHYFGRPSELGQLAEFCSERQIMLLEDCALSLFSKGIGHLGDAAIFSPRKSIAACDGGVLALRDAPGELLLKHPAPLETTRSALSQIKKWMQQWLPALRRSVSDNDTSGVCSNPSLPDLPESYYWNDDSVVRKGSRLGLGALNRVNAVEVVSKRRANYALLTQSLSDLPGMRFLWEAESLADGICPLGVPVLVNNRRQWWRRLNAAGVVVSCWWEGYHRAIDWSEFPEARMLKDRLILLPVHQGLGRQHMQYIAETVRDIRTDMT